MNRRLFFSAALAASCMLFGCKSETPQSSDGLVVIDIDHPNISDPLPTDKVIESVRLLPLKGDVLFKGLNGLLLADDRIFVLDAPYSSDEPIKIFDINGNYLKSLHIGSGPGEIDDIGSWYWDDIDKRLYVYNSTQWIIFDKDGNFIDKRDAPLKYIGMSRFGDEYVFNCPDFAVNDSLGHKFFITDNSFNIKYAAMDVLFKVPLMIVSPNKRFFGQSNESPWFVRADTVYLLNNTQLVPRYYFKFKERFDESQLASNNVSSNDVTGYLPGSYRDNGITQTFEIASLNFKNRKYVVRDKKSGHYFVVQLQSTDGDKYPCFYLDAQPFGKDLAVHIDDWTYNEFIPELLPLVSESDKKLLEEFQVEDNPIIVIFKTKEF